MSSSRKPDSEAHAGTEIQHAGSLASSLAPKQGFQLGGIDAGADVSRMRVDYALWGMHPTSLGAHPKRPHSATTRLVSRHISLGGQACLGSELV